MRLMRVHRRLSRGCEGRLRRRRGRRRSRGRENARERVRVRHQAREEVLHLFRLLDPVARSRRCRCRVAMRRREQSVALVRESGRDERCLRVVRRRIVAWHRRCWRRRRERRSSVVTSVAVWRGRRRCRHVADPIRSRGNARRTSKGRGRAARGIARRRVRVWHRGSGSAVSGGTWYRWCQSTWTPTTVVVA